MGFTLYQGPEVDDDKHVFTMLNFAADHPARDMQDTFFIEKTDSDDVTKNVLLRSHTSNDEAHYMETHEPPIRVLCPGRVYRNEAISARAHCFFHQVEGLYVDKNVSFTDLKQVLLTFAREMFGADTKIRLRPSYFPFTEPSAEMDISCNICGGKGCNFCKHTGWVEILGCGMVDPHDLEACGIDSNVYTGYAFGMGVERITNLKYRVVTFVSSLRTIPASCVNSNQQSNSLIRINMKKITVNTIIALALGSMCLSSCIGSFSLTNNVLNWNKRATDNKFINELIFHCHQPCLCSLLSS